MSKVNHFQAKTYDKTTSISGVFEFSSTSCTFMYFFVNVVNIENMFASRQNSTLECSSSSF